MYIYYRLVKKKKRWCEPNFFSYCIMTEQRQLGSMNELSKVLLNALNSLSPRIDCDCIVHQVKIWVKWYMHARGQVHIQGTNSMIHQSDNFIAS